MAIKGWLADTSAIVRIDFSPDSDEWKRRIRRGLLHIAAITRLELGFSARSSSQLQFSFSRPPINLLLVEYATEIIEDRAFEVLGLLAQRGHHRAPSPADLILAATAELNNLTILHVDKDFERIAAITGQPIERLRLESD
jgi:predicted nucleic acid-binding protein